MAWHPRISLLGEVVSGHGTAVIGDTPIMVPGYRPCWLDNDTVAAIGVSDALYSVPKTGGTPSMLHPLPFSGRFGAGAGNWIAAADNTEIWLDVDPILGWPLKVLERGGDNNDHGIEYNGEILVDHLPVNEARAYNGRVVWRQYGEARDSGIWGYAGGTIYNLRTVNNTWEAWPVTFETSEGPWFSFMTNWDIRLRPWSSTMGYIIPAGEDKNLYHDSMGLGSTIRVAWCESDGTLHTQDISLGTARVETAIGEAGMTPAPPPESTPPMYVPLGMIRVDVEVDVPMAPAMTGFGAPPEGTGGGGEQTTESFNRPKLTLGGQTFEYRGATAFGLFAQWLKGDTAKVDTTTAALAEQGVTILRVIGMLKGGPWDTNGCAYYPGDGIVSTSEDSYYTKLADFARYLDTKNLALEYVCFASLTDIPKYAGQEARLDHVERAVTALKGIGGVMFEIINEPSQNGLDDTTQLAELAQKVLDTDSTRQVALGSAHGGDWENLKYAIAPSTYVTFHGERGTDWSWLTQYVNAAPLLQKDRFPIEDEPQRPEFDPEPGKYFALGVLAQMLQMGATFHFGEGLTGDAPTGVALTCLVAMKDGFDAGVWDFGGSIIEDYATGSPLVSQADNPVKVVSRVTRTDMQLIAMGCPPGWSPSLASGWQEDDENRVKRGTADCAQFMTAKNPSGTGGTGTGTGSGGEGGALPAEAPNHLDIVKQVESEKAPNGQDWNLAEENEDAQNGRGKFTEVVVDRLHALDPRWGHIRKNPGQNQFNGHAVDAIVWKNPDGVTGEGYDIVTGSGTPTWGFSGRDADVLELWVYPI